MTNLLEEFHQYLKPKKLSKKSVKNYISDVRQFLEWSDKNDFRDFTPVVFKTYKSHLIDSKIPSKSINRYLSSLRCFGEFLKKEKLMMINPVKKLENVKGPKINPSTSSRFSFTAKEKILEEFKQSLKDQHLSKKTITNYISDTKQFLEFMNSKNS